MLTDKPPTPIRSVEDLERYGVPVPMNRDKVLTRLRDVHREWLAATPLVFIASSSPDGRCDVSPKGDPPGFIHIQDDTTILIPERPGNLRMDGFHNILANPHVGIVCLIPGRGDTLRINGRATIMANPPAADAMAFKGHRPVLALQVQIEEVFFHCPKAFRRAKAWDPDQWNPEAARPYAQVAMSLWRKGEPAERVLAHYEDHVYNESLYPAQPPPGAAASRTGELPAGDEKRRTDPEGTTS